LLLETFQSTFRLFSTSIFLWPTTITIVTFSSIVSSLFFLFVPLDEVKGTSLFLYLLTLVKATYILFVLFMRRHTYMLRSVVLSLSLLPFFLYYVTFCVHVILFSSYYMTLCFHAVIIPLYTLLSILDFLIIYI
jgi:hypothetical protein